MSQSRKTPDTGRIPTAWGFCLALTLLVPTVDSAHASEDVAELQRLVDEAHAEFKGMRDGANANYIPILDEVDSELFGIAIELNERRSINPLVNAGGIVGFSPRLNDAGNSVRALRAIHYIGTRLGTSLFLAQD